MPESGNHTDTRSDEIAVVIPPGFSFLSLGSLLAPLEFVQQEYPEINLQTVIYAAGNLNAEARSNLQLHTDLGIKELRKKLAGRGRPRAVFICCGQNVPVQYRESLRWLMRDCVRHSVRLFGIGSANWVMAEIEVLPSDKAAIHWASFDAFAERNDRVEAKNNLFVSDGKTTSCAGELSTLDLVIDFLADEFGEHVAQKVCDQFLVSFPRSGDSKQPGSAGNRLRHAPEIIKNMVRTMRETIGEEMSIKELADIHSMSQRQIERIFRRDLNCSPSQYLKNLRVEMAHQLCEQTDLDLQNIALACGFGTYGILSKHFKRVHGLTPREVRQQNNWHLSDTGSLISGL